MQRQTIPVNRQENNDTTHTSLPIIGVDHHKELSEMKQSAKEYVRRFLFSRKQFVSDDDMRFGGIIQKLTCKELNLTNRAKAETFWDYEGGQEVVRTAIRQKRQIYMHSIAKNLKRKSTEQMISNKQMQFNGNKYFLSLHLLGWFQKQNIIGISPPTPQEIIDTLWTEDNNLIYYKFINEIVSYALSKHVFEASMQYKMYGNIVTPSQEAFIILCYKNGYNVWKYEVEEQNELVGNQENVNDIQNTKDKPGFEFTRKTPLRRNGGWTAQGMNLFAEIDQKIRSRRETHKDFPTCFKNWYKRNSSVGIKRKRELEAHPLSKIKIPHDLNGITEEGTGMMEEGTIETTVAV